MRRLARQSRLSRHLTIREVAESFGITPRQLKRKLLSIEQRTGKRILVRVGGEVRPRFLVTIGLLRKHCPEMFDVKTEVDQALDERFEQVNEELNVLQKKLSAFFAKMREFNAALGEISEKLNDQIRPNKTT